MPSSLATATRSASGSTGSGHGRAGTGHDGEWHAGQRIGPPRRPAGARRPRPAVVASGQQAKVVAAQAQQADGLPDRHVHLGGRVHDAVVNPVSLAGAMASRAIARPIRFASDPPLVTVPPNPVQPTASASQETTVRSITAVAGPDRQAVPFWLITDANRSPKAPTGSPEPIT